MQRQVWQVHRVQYDITHPETPQISELQKQVQRFLTC